MCLGRKSPGKWAGFPMAVLLLARARGREPLGKGHELPGKICLYPPLFPLKYNVGADKGRIFPLKYNSGAEQGRIFPLKYNAGAEQGRIFP